MNMRDWFRPPRHLLALFAVVVLVPACASVWLAVRVLEQDRAAMLQADRDRLDNAADLAAGRMLARLSTWDDQLAELPAGDGAIAFRLTPNGVEHRSGVPLLYHPVVGSAEVDRRIFDHADAAEFRRRDYPAAIKLLAEIASTPNLAIRAAALLRISRIHRKSQQMSEALRTLNELEALRTALPGGEPADLVAIRVRCEILEQASDPRFRSCVEAYQRGLLGGRWRLERSSFEFHAEQARKWLGDATPAHAEQLALAAAVDSLWNTWRSSENTRGRQIVHLGGLPVLLLWRCTPASCDALAAGERWISSAFRSANLRVALIDPNNRWFAGETIDPGVRSVFRSPMETRLPWAIRVASTGPDSSQAAFLLRRRALMTGAAVIVLLAIAGSYFIARAVSRELAVARLQTDFVSAVSHEFRTPLTTLRHMTEVLDRGAIAEERRSRYYQVLARETERLHRLVESLLDFGRMEAGRAPYDMRPVEAAPLVRDIVDDFRHESASSHRIDLFEDAAGVIRADRDALGRALWNVLDNAVKYSPGAEAVRIETAREGPRFAIHVRDSGAGIAPAEQKEIFRKFVRGQASRDTGAKGTGIGLAMVDHIIRAHGGEIRLESEPNQGTTFTFLLPLEHS